MLQPLSSPHLWALSLSSSSMLLCSLVRRLRERNGPWSIMPRCRWSFWLIHPILLTLWLEVQPRAQNPSHSLGAAGGKLYLTTAEIAQRAQTHHLDINWSFFSTPLRVVIPDTSVYLLFPRVLWGKNLPFLVPIRVLWRGPNSFLHVCFLLFGFCLVGPWSKYWRISVTISNSVFGNHE